MKSELDINITIDDPKRDRGVVGTKSERAVHIRIASWHFVFVCAREENEK